MDPQGLPRSNRPSAVQVADDGAEAQQAGDRAELLGGDEAIHVCLHAVVPPPHVYFRTGLDQTIAPELLQMSFHHFAPFSSHGFRLL